MVDVSRTFTVPRPLPGVVAYLRDFAHAVEWDPGTQKCEQIGVDPIGIGTRWHNTSKLYGVSTDLVYELTRDDEQHLTFTGTNKTATSTDDMTFEPVGDESTRITYHAHVAFNGVARIADPLVRIAFERIADQVTDQLTRSVERRV